MRDPFATQQVRIIVQIRKDGGEWTDVDVAPMTRRGPGNAFSSGSVGYHAGKPLDLGRPGRVNVTWTETGTKGLGVAVVKGEQTAESKAARELAKRQEAESFYGEPTARRNVRTA